MGETIKTLIYPTREDIVRLNLYHIANTGGFCQGSDNLLSPGSLEWVLDAIQYPLFGVDCYPTVVEKAAILTWTIINGHVFRDANKRTGISALKIFLRINEYEVEASDIELIDVALAIAESKKREYSLEDFTQWIRDRLRFRV